MSVLFNGNIIEGDLSLSINDRALQFGDGLFETIAVRDGHPKLLTYHFDRLTKGCIALHLNHPSFETVERDIAKIIALNSLNDATVKLIIWRSESSAPAYDIQTDQFNYLLKSKPFQKKKRELQNAGIAKSIFFTYTPLSRFKTLNSLPYILAAKERADRKLDELIVLNNKGHVCECVSSNIFWFANDRIYTPSLNTGCLDGVMRRALINYMREQGHRIEIVESEVDHLLGADTIIITNSSGVRFINQIDNKEFITSNKFIDNFINHFVI